MKVGRIVAIVLGIAVVGYVGYRFATPKKEVVTDTRPSVRTLNPSNRDIAVYTEQIGTIEPARSTSVFPKMAGEVLSVNFNAGDMVKSGDVLATINSDALTSLKIQVDAAKVSMDDTATALSRTQALADTGAVAEQALEQANSAATSARLNYEAAKSQYDLQASYTSIKAPVSGIIETKSVEVHDMVAGSAPIAVISSNDGKEVKFAATSEVQRVLKPGDEIKVSYDKTDYQGNITEISNVVSAATGLYEAKASLDDAAALQTGTKVKLTLLKDRETDAITIPISAVLYSGNDAFVYVYEDGKAIKKDITAGIYDSEYIVVKEGLSSSDNVISTWSNEMYDGAEVVISDDSSTDMQTSQSDSAKESETTGTETESAETGDSAGNN